jgi:S1-C subfamily serine protease
VAIPAKSGPWDAVYPPNLLELDGQGIADGLAGPMPGAEAYAGVEVSAVPGDPSGPALVSSVITGSPADDAGIQDDDEILNIGGQTVTSPADVSNIISGYRPGQRVTVKILRRGTRGYVRHTLTLTLGYRPA